MKIHSEVANLVVIIYILRMMTTHQRIGLPVLEYSHYLARNTYGGVLKLITSPQWSSMNFILRQYMLFCLQYHVKATRLRLPERELKNILNT